MVEVQIEVDAASSVPPFEQVRVAIADRIRSGELPVGTRLPTVRGLADDLSLAPNTVARAYRELEAAGLVTTSGRRGTVVAAAGDAVHARAAHAATVYAEATRRLGLSADDALAFARAALEATRAG